MKKILLYCFILLCSLNVLAGKRVIKGLVLGEDGYPISGASITEKGTTSGVGTDIDGKFKMRIMNKNSKAIEVMYMGFQTQEVKLDKEQEFYTITLVEDAPSEAVIIYMDIINQRRRGGNPDIKFSEEDLAREYRRIEERATEVPVDGKNKKK
jgi:hypothetical protein